MTNEQQTTLMSLDAAKTRLAIARAEEIELRNSRTKKDLMTLVEVDGLLARLHSRFLAMDFGSQAFGERVAKDLADEMALIRETIQVWKAQS